jgi:hypothetical protein
MRRSPLRARSTRLDPSVLDLPLFACSSRSRDRRAPPLFDLVVGHALSAEMSGDDLVVEGEGNGDRVNRLA